MTTRTVIYLSAHSYWKWDDRLRTVMQASSLWSVFCCLAWIFCRTDIPFLHRLREAMVSPWRVLLYLVGRRDEARIMTHTLPDVVRRNVTIANPYSGATSTDPTGSQPTTAERAG